jgi:FAD/FMN-containing dehydrogenase
MASGADLIAQFAAITGEQHALTDTALIAPYLRDWRGAYTGASRLVLRPGSIAEVSAILALAQDTRTHIVPQGGNTGLVGGSIPDESGNAVIVSMSRMASIRALDPVGNTVVVEAGCTLQTLREAALAADRLFPLALASGGTCQIGGNLATNAGGIAALSHGVARDLCLGLEVVLPGGAVINGLRTLKKDNRGYDLKNLFIGSEGTLGIITAASLKLAPKPKGRALTWIGVASPAAAMALFHRLHSDAGSALTAFELCSARAVDFAVRHGGFRAPLAGRHEWWVLAERISAYSVEEAETALGSSVLAAIDDGLAEDAVIAGNGAQALAFMGLREAMSDAQKPEGLSIKHDISVPVAAIAEFIARAEPLVELAAPGARVVCFGHMGDGNLHFNVSQPKGGDAAAFKARSGEVSAAVHALVAELGGSFSAEHGIGRMKRELLASTHDPASLALMRTLKAAIDPYGIMNPGKVL